jgi:hypothetical protein
MGNGITLIAVTGWGQVSDKRPAFAAGFDPEKLQPLLGS